MGSWAQEKGAYAASELSSWWEAMSVSPALPCVGIRVIGPSQAAGGLWQGLSYLPFPFFSSREITVISATTSSYQRSENCASFTSPGSVPGLRTAPTCTISFGTHLSRDAGLIPLPSSLLMAAHLRHACRLLVPALGQASGVSRSH